MRWWSAVALLLLQASAHTYAAEQKAASDGTTDPASPASEPPSVKHDAVQRLPDDWVPYQNGWEQFNDAMTELRKIKTTVHRKYKRTGGLFGTILQYALKALPTLRVNAPTPEHSTPAGISGPLLDGVKLLHQSADQNNTDAIFLLAQMNFFGNYTYPRNFKSAFAHYKRLADFNGNASAQHMVGLMYATGVGDAVERDQAKALLYHTFAADAGNTRSEMTVAARHHSGIGVPKNCHIASRYYKRVADKAMAWVRSGPPGGMMLSIEAHRLADDAGGVYGEGASVASSGINALKASPHSDAAIDDAIEYWDLMSQKGDFKASYHLGLMYYDGQRGLERNLDLARRYFGAITTKYWRAKDGRTVDQPKPGLEKYASKAAGYIGRMWLRGDGVRQDFQVAQRWFERGVKHGDAQSQWGMGMLHLHGFGMPINVAVATKYFKAAADQDYNAAHVALGTLHLDQGLPHDLKIAAQYFEAAARWGNIEAQYYLAEMIHHGVGRDKTCGAAMTYYKIVSEKAEPVVSSWKEANQAYDDGDHELAFLGYLLAAEQGYERAQNNVAYMLDSVQSQLPLPSWLLPKRKAPRPSLLQNSALALIYWTRSAIQNNIDSLVKMGDYYLDGIGADRSMEKAAECYLGASEYFQSAQALYNLGWMHENGIGVPQDFHLAKRKYDQALETNEEAYLPVTVSLLKLRLRSAWNTLTNGRVNSIQDEPSTKKDWSLGEWLANFLQEDAAYYDDMYDDYYDDDVVGAGMVGSDGEPLVGGDDLGDEGIVESLVILGLAAAILLLMYYRAQRQQRHRRAQEDEAAVARQQQNHRQAQQHQQQLGGGAAPPAAAAAAQAQDRGLFPQPGDPDFAQWAAGGVGH